MRTCPVCESPHRSEVFSMSYKIPDGWPLPDKITWFTCDHCGMLYGDGDMTQAMFDEYYKKYYGYGVNNPMNVKRLGLDAAMIASLCNFNTDAVIVDFGGRGDDGRSIIVDELFRRQFLNASCRGPAEELPAQCDVIYASHVIEHIYNLPETMQRLCDALSIRGVLIIDVPDATGLLEHWKMPILDFNTKHLNHFTLRNLLDLGNQWGLELVKLNQYDLELAPAYQAHFRRFHLAQQSWRHILNHKLRMERALRQIRRPVNVWGIGDIVWYMLSTVDVDVLDYIDNDPAYRGATFKGKPVLERPTNDAPIVILAQGQRGRLIENIRKMGIQNRIIEI